MDNFLGQAVRSVRIEQGLTLRQLADRVGCAHGTIARKETGLTPMTNSDLDSLARALGITLDDLAKRAAQLAESMPKINAGRVVEQPESSIPYVTIQGDSMEPYYSPGDVLQVRSAQWGEHPAIGEPVIVYLHPESGHEGEAMFTWLPLANGTIRLGKANSKYPSIDVRPEHIGRLLRVVRVVSRANSN